MLLACGGAALAGYLELIVHGENGFQVVPGTFLFFMTTYALHALVSMKVEQLSLPEIRKFWTQAWSKLLLLTLAGAWVMYISIFGMLGLGYLAFACSTPIYSMIRKQGGDHSTVKRSIVKYSCTLLAILGIFFYGMGFNIFTYDRHLFFLIVHLSLNIIIGDLRDLEFDRQGIYDESDIGLDFLKIKQALMLSSLMLVMISLIFAPVWSLVFLINSLLLFKLSEDDQPDVYHTFDLLHFLPWLSVIVWDHFF